MLLMTHQNQETERDVLCRYYFFPEKGKSLCWEIIMLSFTVKWSLPQKRENI